MCWDGDISRCVAFRCTACTGLGRAAVERTLSAFARRPQLARFCLAEVPRSTIPSLRERHIESRQRFVAVLSEERGHEAGETSRLHLELVTGAAHHAVCAQMTGERCDLDSIRARIDDLIAGYVPAPS
jgi:hypothetical protein